MEVYITKYALTKGIYKRTCTWDQYPETVSDMQELGEIYHLGRDCYEQLESAQNKVIHMQFNEIYKIKKQIKKLEAMNFNVVES